MAFPLRSGFRYPLSRVSLHFQFFQDKFFIRGRHFDGPCQPEFKRSSNAGFKIYVKKQQPKYLSSNTHQNISQTTHTKISLSNDTRQNISQITHQNISQTTHTKIFTSNNTPKYPSNRQQNISQTTYTISQIRHTQTAEPWVKVIQIP